MGVTVEICICCGSPNLESSPAIWMPFVSHRAMGLPPLSIDSSTGLTNIAYGVSYALCKSLMCRLCGHLFADYRFSDREMANLYADYRGSSYTSLRESYEPGYSLRNKLLSDGVPYIKDVEKFLATFLPATDIKVLDWGGDTGTNTPFKERRALLHIFDPSDKSAAQPGAVSFSTVPTERVDYDLIVLSNVLEHIPFPSETLNEIARFMSAASILYVEVPLEALQLSAGDPPYCGASKKSHWHEHINFFTPQSMEHLLNRCGFTVLSQHLLDISGSNEKSGISAAKLLQYACKFGA